MGDEVAYLGPWTIGVLDMNGGGIWRDYSWMKVRTSSYIAHVPEKNCRALNEKKSWMHIQLLTVVNELPIFVLFLYLTLRRIILVICLCKTYPICRSWNHVCESSFHLLMWVCVWIWNKPIQLLPSRFHSWFNAINSGKFEYTPLASVAMSCIDFLNTHEFN